MRKTLLALFLLPFAQLTSAQTNNLIVFSEDGHPFHLIVNGMAQNATPETSVRVEGVTNQSNRLKFIFDDDTYGPTDKTVFLSEYGREYTYKVKHSAATGDLVIKLEGSKPIAGLVPAPQPNVVSTPVGGVQASVGINAGGTSMQVGSTATSSSFNMSGSTNMSVSVTGVGVDPFVVAPLPTYQEVQIVNQPVQPSRPPHYVMPGYTGPIGCPWPIDQGQFSGMKQSISSKTWDETKLSQAKTMISTNCLTADQVRDLVKLMGWEQTRLDLAKYAYAYTYDIGNYWKVNDAFEWEQSITDLNAFISRR